MKTMITCMLGTISHFGWNKNGKFKDDLQNSIVRFHSLLNDGAMLIFSNWTILALNSHTLSIYRAADKDKLIRFTERIEVLKKRLEEYFIITREYQTHDKHLDIIVCKK